ncbi:WcaI family glycosyltransferase [Algoriphagus zhangzhouensis]|uniref:Colanic acid biosynthesis glycosyl transferase WcaI n=1 Tax=Algoriphagus zhangzhouensis TaxID=1073327 RepID=A0A1M7Z3L5_9BACT|nr:WcaI family glycosyltransferase [Algoriphagus zhangzhouensis]TDY48375.1 colanic acid biosynthesis glycosyl transferase WcaI [Algoriphagus zhangzhouensis]SHO59422.1 colanic acid biosynthesis glycosyl transferase WcaI [Algoriphagus zhangzhouensis]
MRILVFGINSAPDLTGIGKYTGEMNAFLAENGNEVTMVTAHPYYPEWTYHPDYPKYFWKTEKKDGVKVFRCPLYVPTNPTAAKKILHECTFLISSIPVWLKLLFSKKYDYVLSINPPFHLTVFPLFYKWIRGGKLISHIQDLQVDVVNDMGMIKNKGFLKAMFGVERFFLKQSDWVSTISLGMERKIASKGVEESKQIMFPNWVDTDFIKPIKKQSSLRSNFGISNQDKVVLYSGNLGEKQGLELILEVADRFKEESNIKFLIFGSGGAKERLEAMKEEMGLENVMFFPLQAYEDLPKLLAVADLHLVLQKKEASDLVMPSKLTGILSAGGLAVITAVPETTLYEVVSDNKMGILVEPGCADALYNGIEDGLNKVGSEQLKSNARFYAEKYLAKDAVLGAFERKLKEELKS